MVKMCPPDSPRSTTSSGDFKTQMPKSSKQIATKTTKKRWRDGPKSMTLTQRQKQLDLHIGIRALSFYWFSMDTRIKILQTFPRNVSCFQQHHLHWIF